MSFRSITTLVRRYAPTRLKKIWFRFVAQSLRRRLARATSIRSQVELATRREVYRSNQKALEMEALLERVIAIQPCVMCEIGSDCGGTLALFGRNADSNAKIISIDLNDSDERLVAFDQLVSPSIQLVTLVGNSHDASTLDQLEAALEGRSLDVLFIDGDHSLEGVYQDFRDYAPLLREGGILAFHDIVSDKVESASEKSATIYAGGVPEFYSKYIENAFSGESFIANQSQSGYGIGFVSWPDKTRANALVAQVVSEFEYCNDHRSEHRSKAA